MTLDVLICCIDKGMVRIADALAQARNDVHYIMSYQYTDERYLDLIPAELKSRSDVTLYTYKGKGLSANRNLALEKATAELVMYLDDDTRLTDNAFETIFHTMEKNPEIDVAFFCASTYTGKPLKNYPQEECVITTMPKDYTISAIEMVARRTSIQGCVRFDERFGLGTPFLTCGEEDIWMVDATKANLKMHYFPTKIVETSTLLKKAMIYVDAGVQRSYGAISYYKYGRKAWLKCFQFATNAAKSKMAHFWPLMRHMSEGIRFMQKTS
ncbi:MAG: glycosyltransferase family 2 protein [Alloprevotella sp.]|nr:glycosyltransferase family 2 protein [Alloprevotella sp.]